MYDFIKPETGWGYFFFMVAIIATFGVVEKWGAMGLFFAVMLWVAGYVLFRKT